MSSDIGITLGTEIACLFFYFLLLTIIAGLNLVLIFMSADGKVCTSTGKWQNILAFCQLFKTA